MHLKILLTISSILILTIIPSVQAQNSKKEQEFQMALEAGLKAGILGPDRNLLVEQGSIRLPKGYIFIPKRGFKYGITKLHF